MFNSQVEEIKNRLNIVEVIGGYIKLKKAGANHRGVCPFHSEKKPSFFVSPARQIWHCFGCGLGGDIFGFIKQIEGVEFGDALRILAQKAGIELKKQDPELRTARQRLYEICELACLFFEAQLKSSVVGQEAKKYLLSRGIKEESIKKWRLGYSPEVWQGLSDFLVSKGYDREEIEKAGLAIKSEKSQGFYDRFRGRIMFPVFDLNSQVIGFGARVFKKVQGEEEIAKYINTPQTLLYDKSQTLYGLNYSKVVIRKQAQCVITEGYTDVIMAHQAGFENTVAVSGTALTSYHLNILKRYSENLVLAFDMDIAGDSATKRGIDLAQGQGFGIKIIKRSAANSDPADVILENPANWEKAVKEARSILDFYFDSALSSYDKNTPEGKKEIGKILLPVIKRIPNKIEQSFWVQKLSSTLSVREDVILEELKKVKTESVSVFNNEVEEKPIVLTAAAGFIKSEGRKKILEEKIISLILKDPEILDLINVQHLPLFSEKVKKFLEDVKKFVFEEKTLKSENKDFKKIVADFSAKYKTSDADEDLKNFLAALSLRAEVEYDEDAEEEIQLCLTELKLIELKNKLKEISEEIKKAENEKNLEKINNLMADFNNLSKQL
ncbi:DNA primase [Patescibacteria group bacterium]|nr:DNA primase [Patescibacteria group bacterium]MBU4275024.1 DNA primase [Patescibacteria group bacterium]MBU4367594.1 DNA primase [Patescibacteria group bacterium]MBU4462063.1 DNA primase [Patescibacteria group bacterium]MCG2700449.1 DNA primase [Candidatus Parcubacteria bacterium]